MSSGTPAETQVQTPVETPGAGRPEQPAPLRSALDDMRGRIGRAARGAGRDPADIRLIAVSKAQTDDRIAAALAAGLRCFGENRVQEARHHWAHRRLADLDLHMLGSLQTNKAAEAVAFFDAIHSLDRLKLAEALARAMVARGRRPACYIQVNIGEEAQKSGVAPVDTPGFVADCRDRLGLPVVGLMCIPPRDRPPAPFFALLREMAARARLPRLSMGMSADFEIAIAQGATDIRLGTAIFGARAAPGPASP